MLNLSHLQLGDVLDAQRMSSAEPVHFMPTLQRPVSLLLSYSKSFFITDLTTSSLNGFQQSFKLTASEVIVIAVSKSVLTLLVGFTLVIHKAIAWCRWWRDGLNSALEYCFLG